MPIKLSLVLIKRQNPSIVAARQINYKPQNIQKKLNESTVETKISTIENQQSKGLSLRRVMNAPKTSCKRCGG